MAVSPKMSASSLTGSGAGWNVTLSRPNNFTAALHALVAKEDVPDPSGFSSDVGWSGGLRCREGSHQFGGFPGGGAGCRGGGGGAGFIGEALVAS